MSRESENPRGEPGLEIREVVVGWRGKTYRITAGKIIDAFYRAEYGDFAGSHGRFYLAIDGELKSAEIVFMEMVPIVRDELTEELAATINGVFAALGFEVLDRHQHHE